MTRPARSVREPFRFPGPLAHRCCTGVLGVAVAALALTACGGPSDEPDGISALLLSDEQLGDEWVASDPGEVALQPGSVAPPCPFEGEIPDIELAAATSIEFGNEERRLGINHTVVELDDDPEGAQAVLDTWQRMDCSDSDATQRPVVGLPADVFGVELDTVDSDFTQTVLVRVEGSTVSFLVVTGEGDVVVDLTQELAPLI